MNIKNYKYDENTFEQNAYELMLRRAEAEKKLSEEEKRLKKNISNLDLKYYKAFLDYMHTDNEHMGSFLAYLKHECEMTKKTVPLFFNDEVMTSALNENVKKAQSAFDLYAKIYEDLKKIEFELKEAIQSFQDQKFDEDATNLFSLHMILSKLDSQYFMLHNYAEQYRDMFGFPLVEECLALRNKGLKFETYAERAKNIVKSYDSQPEA